ncbi:transmembrane alpha-helix domain-containing [Fusarium albosuccineum]|uniref:Transmembrane alpha-helix domain-containing n=1 Tax=Fusarium albosuccineum TaxID=1237068 RepID=A0A8H4L617_9HYPO|nr:transmembrane alpha-helix domain-containing [Fusarium albosuccineum]
MATTSRSNTPAHDGTAPAGALTTVFTPPAGCVEDQDLYYHVRTCMPLPERWSLYWGAASYYSPGICPSGMVSVAKPPPFFGPPIEPNASIETDTTRTRSYYNTTTGDNVYPIQVRWHASDLASLETHPLSPGVTPTSFEGEEGGNSGDEGDQAEGRLSGGAIAGIVIGAVALVSLLGIAAFLLHRRRRRREKPHSQQPGHAPSKAFESSIAPATTSNNLPADGNFVPTGNEEIDEEMRRIAARRARLLELEHLEEQQDRLRRQADSHMPFELSSTSLGNPPAEMGSPSR